MLRRSCRSWREKAEPSRRQQARVEREEEGSGRVEQAFGRPHLPADAAADRVVTGGQPDREKTNGHKGDDCEDEQTQDGRDGKHDQRLEHCARERVGVANPPTDQCDPGHQREDRHTGQEDRGDAVYRHPAGCTLRMFGRPR